MKKVLIEINCNNYHFQDKKIINPDCLIRINHNEFAVSSENKILICLLNLKNFSLKILKTLDGHTNWINQMQISKAKPELMITCSNDKTIKLWNIITGKCLKTLQTTTCLSILMLSDNILVSCGNGGVKVWNIYNGECMKNIQDERILWCLVPVSDNEIAISGNREMFDIYKF